MFRLVRSGARNPANPYRLTAWCEKCGGCYLECAVGSRIIGNLLAWIDMEMPNINQRHHCEEVR